LGEYHLYYTRDAKQDDLIINLYEEAQSTEILKTSGLILAIPKIKEFDFTYNAETLLGVPEVSKIELTLSNDIKNTDFALLTKEDVEILANQHDISTESIDLYLKAQQIFNELTFVEQITVDIIYALLSTGLSQDTNILFSQTADVYRKSLLQAAKINVLPNNFFDDASSALGSTDSPISGNYITPILESIITGLQRVLKDNINLIIEGEFSLNDLFIRTSIVSNVPRKIDFIVLYQQNSKTDDVFWIDVLAASFSVADIEILKFNLNLMKFVEYDIIVYNLIQTYCSQNTIKTMSKFALQNLIWSNFVNLVELFPSFIEGVSETEKRVNYAKYFQEKIAVKFPSEAIIVNIKNTSTLFTQEFRDFFNTNQDFVFSNQSINIYINNKATPPSESLVVKLSMAQRLFNILPSIDSVAIFNILWDSGINSAHGVIKLGEQGFNLLFENKQVDPVNINETFRKAQNKNSAALAAFSKYNIKTASTATNVQFDRPTDPNNATLETLFNSLDSCDCKDCRSTLSATAYLTDNSAFLNNAKLADGSSVFDELLKRRPDIEKIILNCKNSDTPVPYIDIVNEVLEAAIAGDSEDIAYQTESDPDDIDIFPEHFITSVYDEQLLTNTPTNLPFSSLSLPFNYWNEESKAFLSHFNLKLSNVQELFTNSAVDNAIAYLGMSPQEYTFIINTTPKYPFSGNLIILDFLKDTQLEYNDFVDLLRSEYAYSGTEIIYPEACSLKNATIDLSSDNVDKLLTFKRFLNITGWTLEELDKTIIKFGPVNDDFIIIVSQIKKLQEITGLSVEELLVLWGIIDTGTQSDSDSFYKQRFLKGTTDTDGKSIFTIPFPVDLEEQININDNAGIITSVLGINEADLITLTEQSDSEISFVNLDIINLSYFYRYSLLAKTTGLSIKELLSLQELINDTDIFASPESSLSFIEKIRRVKNSGFTADDLLYLLKEKDIESKFNVSEKSVETFLTKLQTDLKQIITDYKSGKFDNVTLLKDVLKSIKNPDTGSRILDADIETTTKILNKTYINDAFISSHPEIFSTENVLGDTTDVDKRYASVLTGIKDNMYDLLLREKVISSFVIEFGLDIDFTEYILTNVIAGGLQLFTNEVFLSPEALVNSEDYITVYNNINTASAFINNYNINVETYKLFPQAVDITDIFNITDNYENWKNLDSLFAIQAKHFKNSEISILNLYSDSYSDLFLGSTLNINDYESLPQEETITAELLIKRFKTLEISKVLGISATKLSNWNISGDLKAISTEIKAAVKSKYDYNTWAKIASPIMKVLREKRRDALSRYLITNGFPGNVFYDTNDLYDYFLLDTEMSACSKTSRIVLANSTLQLFVQRIQMNLEAEELYLTPEDANEWAWRKKYRVWEANRKVFLYPENWIEPELRDDKSPFFKELEEDLLQVDLDNDTAETIFKSYLEKLDEVAKLEIAQHYFDEETGDLHVFARTYADPQRYYYRKRSSLLVWTAWKKMDIEIDDKILLPVIYNQRMYIFWPVFFEKAKTPTDLNANSEPEKYYEIKFAWSEYKNNMWSPKTISANYIEHDFNKDILIDKDRFYGSITVNKENELIINFGNSFSYEGSSLKSITLRLFMKFDLSKKQLEVIQDYKYNILNVMKESNVLGMKAHILDNPLKVRLGKDVEYPTDENGVPIGGYRQGWTWDGASQRHEVALLDNEISYNLSLPHQYPYFISQSPFFFEDELNTFLVVPNEEFIVREKSVENQEEITVLPDLICNTTALNTVIKASIPKIEFGINKTLEEKVVAEANNNTAS